MKTAKFMKHNAAVLALLVALAAGVGAHAQGTDSTRIKQLHAKPYKTDHSLLPTHGYGTLQMLEDAPLRQRDLLQACRHLVLDIDAATFFFDAEYATPVAKGYSAVGFRLSPTLTYGINERALLRAGFNAIVFAGMDSLQLLRPSLSLIYKPSRWLTIVGGTLYGGFNHRLDAPVYDPSRWLFHYQEDGLQILTATRRWNSDTWIDWHHYLKPWTADQEAFTAGTRHSFRLLSWTQKPANNAETGHSYVTPLQRFVLDMPLHFVVDHRGGEVKTIDTNTVSTFNERVGFHAEYRFRNTLSHSHTLLSADLPVYFYHLEDSDLDTPGKAFYPTLGIEYGRRNDDSRSQWALKGTLGFWHGDHYFSAHGSPALWSVNAYSALHMPASAASIDADVRNLITLRVAYEHEFKNLQLGLQVDAYHDLDLHKTDLLIGFYMRYKEHFRLF